MALSGGAECGIAFLHPSRNWDRNVLITRARSSSRATLCGAGSTMKFALEATASPSLQGVESGIQHASDAADPAKCLPRPEDVALVVACRGLTLRRMILVLVLVH